MKKVLLMSLVLVAVGCGKSSSSSSGGGSVAAAPTPAPVTFNLSQNVCTLVGSTTANNQTIGVYADWDGHQIIKLFANGSTNCAPPIDFTLNASMGQGSVAIGSDTYTQDLSPTSTLVVAE